MYLRTPKRYRRSRRELRLFSGRSLLRLAAIPLLGYVGWMIWQNQTDVRSQVGPRLENFANSVQTQVAPEPTPTATPDISRAQAGCLSAYQEGRITEALVQCPVMAQAYPNDVRLYYQITEMLIITSNFGSNSKRITEALEFAERTVNANPEAPDGWAIRAMALDWNGEVEKALPSALHARALDDTFAPAYAVLGEIYHDLGQHETALSYLDQALNLDTSGDVSGYIFRTRGKVYSDQGYYEDALQPYQAALNNAPNHTYIAVELANNYMALQQNDKAIQVLIGALEKNPTDTSVLFKLAAVHWTNGENDRAYEYFRRCLDVDPDDVPCLSWLGGLQLYDNDYVSALTNLERAIELGSTDPDDYLQAGQILAAMGRCDRASPHLQQGLQIAIENENESLQARFLSELQSCNAAVPETTPQ